MRIALIMLSALTLAAQGPFDGKSGPMVKAGYELLGKGQFNEAAIKFQEAIKADPKASFPLSGLAKLFYEASQHTDASRQAEYRGKAVDLAHDALDLNDLDFIASEVLLNADGGSMGSSYRPKPEAQEAFNAAETAFQGQKWDEAANGYQKALSLDPAYTDAALYLGDTYFSQKQYDKAEPWFRKATEMEPRYARAWRFLTDCYGDLGRTDDAMAADFGAIAAQPNDYTAWGRLRQVYEGQRKVALVRFHWPIVEGSRVTRDASGKSQISVPQSVLGDSPEAGAEAAYSLMTGMTQVSDQMPENSKKKRSPFEREALAWKAAMEVYDKTLVEKKAAPKDATWAQLLSFYKADQLEPALAILQFREAYRPDFEAWKAAHPKGVQAFIEQWHLRP